MAPARPARSYLAVSRVDQPLLSRNSKLTFLVNTERGKAVENPWTDVLTAISDDTNDHL